MKLKKFIILFSIFLLSLLNSTAQADTPTFVGVLPYFSQTGTIHKDWSYNVYLMQANTFNRQTVDKKSIPPRAAQLYFQPSIIYKLHANINLAAGYAYQRLKPYSSDFQNENRAWQQVTLSHGISTSARLTHRFRFDERFIDDRIKEETVFSTRFRYQLGLFLPFSGKTLDPGEFYLNAYNEFYFNTSGPTARFWNDNWAYAGVGYQTDGWGRIEIGPLYQTLYTIQGTFMQFFYAQVGWITQF